MIVYLAQGQKMGQVGQSTAILTAAAEPATIKVHDIISRNAAVNKQIKMRQLITVDVVGNGNCFFRVVAMSIYGYQYRHV